MSEQGPTRFGQCKVLRKLGVGAMATVYLAEHEILRTKVAIKVPLARAMPDEMDTEYYAERFTREARIAARLNHPNIVRVLDAGRQDDLYYMIMDYVEGATAKVRLDAGGRYGWREGVQIVMAVCDALRYAAAEGIVHRDIKPDNFMIDGAGVVRLMDLGLAKMDMQVPSSLTQSSDVLGTPFYMSPEQIRDPRNADPRSDIYSLGATLYHMICGEPPFGGNSIYEVMNCHLRDPIVPPNRKAPDVPESLCDVIAKMMAKAPADRYQDYAALLSDLAATVSGGDVSAMGARTELQTAAAADAPRIDTVRSERVYRRSNLPATFLAPAVGIYGLPAMAGMVGAVLVLFLDLWARLGGRIAGAFAAVAFGGWALRTVLALRPAGAGASPDRTADRQVLGGLRDVMAKIAGGLGLPEPEICVTAGRKPRREGHAWSRRRMVLRVSRGFLDALPLADELLEALALREVGWLCYGHATALALIDVPMRLFRVVIKPIHWSLRRACRAPGKWERAAFLCLAALAVAVMFGVSALLVSVSWWTGVATSLFVIGGLLGQALRRDGEYAADLFAGAVLHDRKPVARLVLEQSLAESQEARVLRAAVQEAAPGSGAGVGEVERLMALFSTTRWTGGPGDRLREPLSGWPAAALRANALAGLSRRVRPLHRQVARALKSVGRLIGPDAARRRVAMPESARVAPYVALGAVNGLLTVVALLVSAMSAGKGASGYFAFVGMVCTLALGLGAVDAAFFRRQKGTYAEIAWSVIVSVFAMTLTGATILVLCGASDYAFLLPVVFVPSAVSAVVGATAWSRTARLARGPQDDVD